MVVKLSPKEEAAVESFIETLKVVFPVPDNTKDLIESRLNRWKEQAEVVRNMLVAKYEDVDAANIVLMEKAMSDLILTLSDKEHEIEPTSNSTDIMLNYAINSTSNKLTNVKFKNNTGKDLIPGLEKALDVLTNTKNPEEAKKKISEKLKTIKKVKL